MYMDNNTARGSSGENIVIGSDRLPAVVVCDTLTAAESFYHIDRVADFNVMIYVTDGEMYVTEGENDYAISAGQLLFLKSGIRHYGRQETPRGTRWAYVHFYTGGDEGGEGTVDIPKKVTGLAGSETEGKLLRLCDTFHNAEGLERLRVNAKFYDILIDLCCESKPKGEGICDRVCDYLDTQVGCNFSKELISGRFYLSYSRLAASFKKEKGISMGEYHNSVRMKRACQLLRTTLMTVGEVADELGFTDMLYFSKKFRSFVGVSPTEYRRQIQNRY